MASPGEVMFSPLELAPALTMDSSTHLGRLELSQGTLINTSGNGGGTVLSRSSHLLVNRSKIFADNTGPAHGSGLGVDLRIAADAVLANGAAITTDSLRGGSGSAMGPSSRPAALGTARLEHLGSRLLRRSM